MPTFKKTRNKGATYKLLPRSYGDADGEEGPVWVSEADFYRSHKNPTAAEEEEKSQQQFSMYAAAANAEFKEARCHYEHTGNAEGDDLDEEEGEWVDGDWEEDEEVEEAVEALSHTAATAASSAAAAVPATTTKKSVSFALPDGNITAESTMRGRARDEKRARDGNNLDAQHHDLQEEKESTDTEEVEDEDEKLFDDEVECEVTDDFLRQLVFGNGEDGSEGDEENDDADWDGLDQEDGEMWRLLTDEEKAAIKASRRRGTARRRKMVATSSGEGEMATRTHAADGTEYPTHDVTQRALDRRFTEMMREFNADARLNDAHTDDPRTHGALPMEKYMTALEEFVTERAGMDVETAEPHKNKGLIQQLKYLSHHAGAFDSDGYGTYKTTLLPEKQQRFVQEFQRGTEEIRCAARWRLAQHQQADAAAAIITAPFVATTTTTTADTSGDAHHDAPSIPAVSAPVDPIEENSEDETMVVEVKSKADRLDCETAVSTYSTYYNQPNVIQAPRRSNAARRGAKKTVGIVKGNVISAAANSPATTTVDKNKSETKMTSQKALPCVPSNMEEGDEDDAHRSASDSEENSKTTTNAQRTLDVIPTVRPKGETKEEKKLRRQAVKTAQRERRQAKSALKSIYKDVESDELKRSATSQAGRRTVHFM